MPTVINTNLASLFAQNSLSSAQNNLAQSVQRLSSGLRINSAKDDAAGLSISQNMQSQINGTNQSIRNLSDATNLLQVADSSLATVQDMLLRLKQLATQGYDGSLSTSQKLNIVQEMKELNAEINATASRTAFNGINLLTSGASLDLVNSALQKGVALSNTGVTVSTSSGNIGYYSQGAAGIDLGDSAAIGGTGAADTTFVIALDPSLAKKTPGTYTLSSNGNNLTLTGTFNGLSQSQTVSIDNAVGNSLSGEPSVINQTLNFSDFGIRFETKQTIAAGKTQTGAQLASAFTTASTSLVINGKSGEVTDVRLSGVAPGTYSMSYEKTGGVISSITAPANLGSLAQTGTPSTKAGVTQASTSGEGTGATFNFTVADGKITAVAIATAGTGYKAGDTITIAANWDGAGKGDAVTLTVGAASTVTDKLTMTGTVDGIATTQSLGVLANAANGIQTLNFDSFGIQFDVTSYQAQSGKDIASELANLTSLATGATAGAVVVAQGQNSALKFQSGPVSSEFIQINTLNIQTGRIGNTAGESTEMMSLGDRITSSDSGNLGKLGLTDSINTWQTAFKNAAAAVDNALEYISTERAVYGSQMNRLSYISTNLQAQSTNLQNSRSSIIDTDFAAETARLTKGQIMQQAATAMLAQANQMPNVILSLLK
jgi:flagellin